tara:strand:+ start:6532 stop:7065 length:534 start_codon:yes stop_codon:yes gene_type:complete
MFKQIPNYNYQINEDGVVKNSKGKTIKQFKQSRGYLTVRLTKDKKGTTFLTHRLVYETFNDTIPPKYQIDHINRNKEDNNIKNLRAVSDTINKMNTPPKKNSSSIFKGVYRKPNGKWRASYKFNKKTQTIGDFSDEQEAARQYNYYVTLKHPNDFIYLNDVNPVFPSTPYIKKTLRT